MINLLRVMRIWIYALCAIYLPINLYSIQLVYTIKFISIGHHCNLNMYVIAIIVVTKVSEKEPIWCEFFRCVFEHIIRLRIVCLYAHAYVLLLQDIGSSKPLPSEELKFQELSLESRHCKKYTFQSKFLLAMLGVNEYIGTSKNFK